MCEQNGYLPLLPRQRAVQERLDAGDDDAMWPHVCPVEGTLMIGRGEPCSWCGATEPRATITGANDSLPSFLRRQAD